MSLQEHDKGLLSICFALFIANNAYYIISSRKMCSFISSVSKKINLNKITPTFQEVGGVTQPRIFCRCHKEFLMVSR